MNEFIKVYVPNTSTQTIGGGWTFLRNFDKGAGGTMQLVSRWQDCDIYFIIGATMTARDEATAAKAAGKRIVLRVDNIPRDSRNRGTAFSRMRDFAKLADVVVYQTEWAKSYAGYLCGDGPVIYNGVDTKIFRPDGEKINRDQPHVCLYVHYNRDENKRFPEAQYHFHKTWLEGKDHELWLVGRYADELPQYKFDFFAGEPVKYLGIVDSPREMAKIMRSADVLYAPYFMDAAPNTVMEALASGCRIELVNPVGGTKELIELYEKEGPRTIEVMAAEYLGLFKLCLDDTAVGVGE